MLGFILGTMTGGVMGVFAMCLFIAGKREDEALERCRMKRKEIIDHGVCICFVNSQGEELFRLADGESLVQNAPNGERNVSTSGCRFCHDRWEEMEPSGICKRDGKEGNHACPDGAVPGTGKGVRPI